MFFESEVNTEETRNIFNIYNAPNYAEYTHFFWAEPLTYTLLGTYSPVQQ